MKKGFHTRSFTSIFSFGSFFIMTITGLVLYFVPQGRVAYWIDWHLLGLSKTQWGNVHIVSSILFSVAGFVHLYLNWKPFWAYLTQKVAGSLRYGKEAAIATVLSVFLFVATLYDVPPLSSIIDLGESLKVSWVKDKSYEPPFGHAELVSIKILAKKEDFDLEAALGALREKNIDFSTADEKLLDVATRNRMSPRDLFAILAANGKKEMKTLVLSKQLTPDDVEEMFAGTGIGRKQFKWVVEDLGLSIKEGKQRLARHGIDVKDDATMKTIGSDTGYDPMELLKALIIPEYVPKREE